MSLPSSQLGALDQNRIALNTQARQAYAQYQAQVVAQQAADAEAKRKAEEAARKAASPQRNPNLFFNLDKGWDFIVPPTYDDPNGQRAVTQSEINPAFLGLATTKNTNVDLSDVARAQEVVKQLADIQAKAETAQDFAIYRALEAKGINPGQLTITRDAVGNITSALGSNNDLKATINPDKSLSFSYAASAPAAIPASIQSQKISDAQVLASINESLQKTGGELKGYAINRDAAGNITDASYTASRSDKPLSEFGGKTPSELATALYIPNIKAKQEAYSAALEAGYENFKSSQAQEGRQGPGPVETRYYLPDPTNPFNIMTESQYFSKYYTVPDPTNPFYIRPKEPAVTKPSPAQNDLVAGLKAPVENTAELIKWGASLGKSEPKSRPELEGDVYGIAIKAVKDVATGKPVTAATDAQDLAENVQKAPLYYAGSAITSAGIWVGSIFVPPLFASKILPLVRGFSTVTRAEEIASLAVKEAGLKLEQGAKLDAEALKTTKGGEATLSPLASTMYSQRVQLPPIVSTILSRPGMTINPEVGKAISYVTRAVVSRPARIVTPDSFSIRTGVDELGYINVNNGKTAIVREGLSDSEKATIAKNQLVESVTDVYQNEARVLPRVSVPVVEGTLEKAPGAAVVQVGNPGQAGKVAESVKSTTSLITFQNKALVNALKADEREARLQAAAAAKLGEIPKPSPKAMPWNFASQAAQRAQQGSRTPLQSLSEYSFDNLLRLSKQEKSAAARAVTASAPERAPRIGLYAGAAVGGLGFRGATGAEKRNIASAEVNESPYEIVSYPQSSASIVNNITKLGPQTSKNVRLTQSSELQQKVIPGQSANVARLQNSLTQQFEMTKVNTGLENITRPVQAPAQTPALNARVELVPLQARIPRFEFRVQVPSVPSTTIKNPPKLPTPIIGPELKAPRKAVRKKEAKPASFFSTTFEPNDLLAMTFGRAYTSRVPKKTREFLRLAD